MKRNIRFQILLVVFTCLLSVCLTSLVFVSRLGRLQPLLEAEKLIERHAFFFEEEQRSELVTGALRGLAFYMDDEYAAYFTREEYAEMLGTQSGNYVGMGIMVSDEEDGRFVIDEVFSGSPAEEAGLLPADQILKINDISCAGYELSEFLALIDNEEGATNTLVIQRGANELRFTLVMREVYRPFVHHQMLEETVGYIHISAFQGQCVAETREALAALEQQDMRALVLDVRDNLGGQLYIVNEIAELFLPADSVITTVRSRAGSEVVYRTGSGGGTDLPIAMLINEYSASGSELLAGALKDHGVARLFGQTTFGKGIVQSFFPLSGTGGMLKFTTDAYYTPNGGFIHNTGIGPDMEVKLPEEWASAPILQIPHNEDTQLQAAVGYLKML